MRKPTFKDKFFNLLFKRLLHFFPLITFSLWMFFLYRLCTVDHNKLFYLIGFILTPYLFPLLSFRLLTAIYPLREGMSYIGINEQVFSSWLFGFRIQQIYIVFPQLERLLFFLPGVYAMWLRLWGSKVGKGVFFVPTITIHDRSHLDIGNHVVFGDRCYLSSHLLQVRDGRFTLYLKKIKIGSNTFVGAMSHMGPGTKIPEKSTIPVGSYYTVNKKDPESILST